MRGCESAGKSGKHLDWRVISSFQMVGYMGFKGDFPMRGPAANWRLTAAFLTRVHTCFGVQINGWLVETSFQSHPIGELGQNENA